MAARMTVTIVGAGFAGLSAACTLAEEGVRCRLLSVQPSERAQSVLAEGGINAVLNIMGEDDSVQEHFADTMRGGVWLADPNAVWGLVCDAPGIVRRLAALGVPFQREHGTMIQRNFGGQKKKRTAYAKSSTGKVLVSALVDAVRRYEAQGLVVRYAHHELVDLGVEDGACDGVWARDDHTQEVSFFAGPVILACGGMGGLYRGLTTGTTTNTGDVHAIALERGVELANLEFLQYHPTTVPIAGKSMLVSEAARGEGGRLFALRDGRRWYFMEERYPELGNLMPRDVVSREEFSILRDPACDGHIYLDMCGLSKRVWRERLSDLRDEVMHYVGIDPAREPVPVAPGIHYCMGGILVDETHRTNVGGLLAAGECACAYHGANRLGGNSLLGAIRGGMVAARSAAEDGGDGVGLRDASRPRSPQCVGPASPAVENTMQRVLASCMGIIRTADELEQGLRTLADLPHTPRVNLASATLACAMAREESRGAHQRADFPHTSDAFLATTVVRRGEDSPEVEFRPLPEPREEVPSA